MAVDELFQAHAMFTDINGFLSAHGAYTLLMSTVIAISMFRHHLRMTETTRALFRNVTALG